MVWASFDETTGRRYVIESNVSSLAFNIGATLSLMINDDEVVYTLINCHLFSEGRLMGPGYYRAYTTRTIGLTFFGHRF